MNRAEIRKIANRYARKYDTRSPFVLADALGIEVFRVPLGGISGFYRYMKRHRCIYLNAELEERQAQLVMAHELGHALLHTKESTYFMEFHTALKVSRYELEANLFAAELLISDEFLAEYSGFTVSQMARMLGYSEKLVKLRTGGV